MTKKVTLFSGRVKTVPPTEVSAERYDFLRLAEAEPSLGAPTAEGAFIYSDTNGVRNWTTELTTDANGNLQTAGVTIVGNRIEARNPTESLELGTILGGTGEVVIDANLTVNGLVNFQGGTQSINLELGSTISIGDNEVLSETTLGETVVNTSIETVATIREGTWEGDPISTAYGGTGIGNPLGITPGAILYGDGLNAMKEIIGQPFQVLQVDATGTPQFQGLDYGRY
jgi:hypothetical protein